MSVRPSSQNLVVGYERDGAPGGKCAPDGLCATFARGLCQFFVKFRHCRMHQAVSFAGKQASPFTLKT